MNRSFVALGNLIADIYYLNDEIFLIDGGGSRFNVIANLSQMDTLTKIIGKCGNDEIGQLISKKLELLGIDLSNIIFINRSTRKNYLLTHLENNCFSYICKKESPITGINTWYEDDEKDFEEYKSKLKKEEVIILDRIDELSLNIIKSDYDIVLDIGTTKRLEKLDITELKNLKNKIEILQLNERVIKLLFEKTFSSSLNDLYKFFEPKLMIVTHGNKGADLVYSGGIKRKEIIGVPEKDPTGAGDAFLSVFTKNFYENSKNVDAYFIDETFDKAFLVTSEVVKKIGARGHIMVDDENNKSLYKRLNRIL